MAPSRSYFEISRNLQAIMILSVVLFSAIACAQDTETPEWCKNQPRAAYKALKRVAVPDQDWFEVYEIKPGVFAIYEPRQFEEVISYLIFGTERAMLFDTGMGIASIRKIVARLTSNPVVVLNSHTHPDHIGGNHEFENILGLNTSFTHKNAAGYRDPEMKKLVHAPNICGPLPANFNPENYAIAPFHIRRFVSDGETLDLGGRKLQILLTPGHTPDSLCLFDSANKLLFTGDTFYLGPIYLFSPETDFANYQKSVARLAKLSNRIDLLLPAHNVPVASPAYLKKLSSAVNGVKNGSAKGLRTNEGLMEYSFEDFSLLIRVPQRSQ
jgi:glyoxylase-like metal-dependent hydrolase (beta-lactamase superfamily II)